VKFDDFFVQRGQSELADASDTLRRLNDGLQLQLAELAGSSKSRAAVAADSRAQLEHIYRSNPHLLTFTFSIPLCEPHRRSRIDSLQREVSDLNSKLIAAASQPPRDDSAAEWAPYFQAAQRDNAQRIQVGAS
jgi:hypothetical protein